MVFSFSFFISIFLFDVWKNPNKSLHVLEFPLITHVSSAATLHFLKSTTQVTQARSSTVPHSDDPSQRPPRKVCPFSPNTKWAHLGSILTGASSLFSSRRLLLTFSQTASSHWFPGSRVALYVLTPATAPQACTYSSDSRNLYTL